MAFNSKNPPETKSKLHPENRHRQKYNFPALIKSYPALAQFVIVNEYGEDSINFFDPSSIKALNKSLLIHFYGIEYWDIPEGYLCPPIPGRADYIHNVADLISVKGVIPTGENVKVLDIGTGANCIYPIIGHHEYGWSFTGTDIDPIAINSAQKIISSNSSLKDAVELRFQENSSKIFQGIIKETDSIDASICNPPFHASADEAAKGNLRKIKGISKFKSEKPALNFGGKNNELWYPGGELGFVSQMIRESTFYSKNCEWFTTLISKESNIPILYKTLEKTEAHRIKTINMAQGNKISRILAWSYKR